MSETGGCGEPLAHGLGGRRLDHVLVFNQPNDRLTDGNRGPDESASKRSRRFAVLTGTYALEGRVALSSIAPSHPSPPPSYVESLPLPDREAVHLISTRAQSTVHPSCHPIRAAVAPTVRRWSWLADTYWYVPTRNLPAVLFNSSTGTLAPVNDQTVFQITGYREGYFWGKTVTQLGSSSASSSSLVGSVTPQGRVLLTFTATSSTSSPSVTEGYGTMQRKAGQWTMENQMFTRPARRSRSGTGRTWSRRIPGCRAGIPCPPSASRSRRS